MLFKNHFKIAIRQLRKQKFYTAINVTGLAVGIACCLMIALLVQHEFSFDRHHQKADRIYRMLWSASNLSQNPFDFVGVVSAPMAKAMVDDYPEVENAGRIYFLRGDFRNTLVRRSGEIKNTFEQNFIYADAEIFEIFDFPVLQGTIKNNFGEPSTIIITEKIAEKYFPNENPIGQTFIIDNDREDPYRICAVVENTPANSHIQFDFVLPNGELPMASSTSWMNSNFYTYVLLKEGATQKQVEDKLPQTVEKYLPPEDLQSFFEGLNDGDSPYQFYRFGMQPLSEMHLYSEKIGEPQQMGDRRYVLMYGAIAFIVLLIAIINFMNLSTARSVNRSKEVGVRKVLGSFKKDLVFQFLSESVLLSFLAFIFGFIFAQHLLPLFGNLMGKELTMPMGEPWFLPGLLGASLLIGVLAGLYPAFYLSRFKPIKVLSGRVNMRGNKNWLRSSLVVVQFASSIILIAATVGIYSQLKYIQNKELGFEKEQVLLIKDTYTIENINSFKDELRKIPEIKSVTASSFIPVKGAARNQTSFWPGGEDPDDFASCQKWFVDHDYLRTMGFNIKEGRGFSTDYRRDSNAVVINESFAENYGITDPIGKNINTFIGYDEETQTPIPGTFTIIGVVEDFHYEPLNKNIEGLCFMLGESTMTVAVKGSVAATEQLLQKTKNVWHQFVPDQEIRYTFLDDSLAQQYEADKRTGNTLAAFALLAIIVACLGLFALATFLTEQKAKEIGIRKVLGASVASVVLLLSKNFLKLVAIGFLIAIPLAWYALQHWLQDFAYRIDLTWWIFAGAGVVAIFIAFFTVGFQSMKAALVNPVESLRSE
ncbi:MAG: ABC transporter permease [Bacteroidota bacterium]